MNPIEQIEKHLDEMWHRQQYLEETLKLEEKYYPGKTNVTDTLHGRLEELRTWTARLQGIYNVLKHIDP